MMHVLNHSMQLCYLFIVQIHQPAMIITLVLTAVSFIIIFVEAAGYVSDVRMCEKYAFVKLLY